MKYSKSGNNKLLILVAGAGLLLMAIIFPERNTEYTDLVRGAMTGVAITFLGTFLLKLAHSRR